MKLTMFTKTLIGLVVAAVFWFGIQYVANNGSSAGKAEVPKTVAVAAMTASAQVVAAPAVALAPLPSKTLAQLTIPQMRMQVMAWNAQMGLMLANGGPTTTAGSLLTTNGANLQLIREDDCGKMQASLLAFATELKKNPQPTNGAHFVIVMGDGSAAFLAGVNPQLAKIGQEYQAEVIGATGFSNGEDKFLGPAAWKENPSLARGGVVVGVLRDGDWNIALKWAGDNGIKNNPDETTYDPDALNWIAANDYIDAAQKFVAGACETRKIVHGGKVTTEKQPHVCPSGVVTWTPGDVTAAKNRGVVVSILSTKENIYQMPAAIIGIRKWNTENAAEVSGLLAGIGQAGDQIKSYPAALHAASEVSAVVYKEETAAYWEKYFVGVTEPDKNGVAIELGGSRANNLADMKHLFGLDEPGKTSLYADVYAAFGDIVVQQYPKLVPSYPKAETVINTTYLQMALAKAPITTVAELPKYTGAPITTVTASKEWNITFKTGSAEFTPDATKELNKVRQNLRGSKFIIDLQGHTDNTGNSANNMVLSERRANAVKSWLMSQSLEDFPAYRLSAHGFGDSKPIGDNATESGRSVNRRVTIVQGTN